MNLTLEQAQLEIRETAAGSSARLAQLLDKSLQFYRSAPERARKWAQEAEKIARKQKSMLDEARASVRLGCASFQLCEFDRAIGELQHALALYDEVDPTSSYKSTPLCTLGMVYSQMGRFSEAEQCYSEALRFTRPDTRQALEIHTARGNAALMRGSYVEAMQAQQRALAVCDHLADTQCHAVILSNIAAIYQEIGNAERAIEYYERSNRFAREAGDRYGELNSTYNLAEIALKQHNLVEAERCAQLCLTLEAGEADLAPYVFDVLGAIALERNDLHLAREWYDQSIRRAEELNLIPVLANALAGRARSMHRDGKAQEALPPLLRALHLIEQEQRHTACELYEELAGVYKDSGDTTNALEYYARHIALRSELNLQQRYRATVEVQAKLEIEKAEKERARLEQLASDAAAREGLLRREAEDRSKELTTLALQLVQKNEFLADLRDEVSATLKVREAKKIASKIDDHVRNDRDWETFEHQFKQVHQDFLHALSTGYPSLTPTELKISAMIKLNLPSKAIANLFCLSTRTVENHRQSIRKKLNLPAESNLVSFLTSL